MSSHSVSSDDWGLARSLTFAGEAHSYSTSSSSFVLSPQLPSKSCLLACVSPSASGFIWLPILLFLSPPLPLTAICVGYLLALALSSSGETTAYFQRLWAVSAYSLVLFDCSSYRPLKFRLWSHLYWVFCTLFFGYCGVFSKVRWRGLVGGFCVSYPWTWPTLKHCLRKLKGGRGCLFMFILGWYLEEVQDMSCFTMFSCCDLLSRFRISCLTCLSSVPFYFAIFFLLHTMNLLKAS